MASRIKKVVARNTKRGVKDSSGRVQGPASLENVIYNKPGYLIRRMHQIAVSIFLDETKEFDLTPLQYGMLATVRAYPGVDQSTLGKSMGLDRTTVVGIVDRLERKGWLLRRTVATDRRVRQLYVTPAGLQHLTDIRSVTDAAQQRMLEPLSEKERAQFVKYLVKILAHHNDDARVPVKDVMRHAHVNR
ncbi:MAG: MarR family winged helix-turn-helix transcriptional regulator [Steroidobacteraceae bacterium]